MKKWTERIKKNWLFDTSKTILLILILTAIFIALNLWITNIDMPYIDTTQEKLYSLSDESKKQVKEITDTITIYFFGIEENTSIVDLAKQYTRENDKIQVEVVTVSDRPDLAEKYGVSGGDQGIVVQSSTRNQIISPYDLSTYDYASGTSIDITEQKLTNALIETTIAKKPTVYFLTGHGETSNFVMFSTFLQNEVNDVKSLNLLSNGMPQDCDCLIISSPQNDFTSYEADEIIAYIKQGGNILWLNNSMETNLPNVTRVLDEYGVTIAHGTVREEDTNYMLLGQNSYIMPSMSYHSITRYIMTDGALLFFDSTKLDFVSDEELSNLKVEVTPILQSSSTSYFDSIDTEETTKEQGPFVLGAECTKTLEDGAKSTLIIYSNSKFASDMTVSSQQASAFALLSNKDLALNSVAYLTDREDAIVLRKDTGAVTYTATASQDFVIRVIIFSVPLIIIAIGIIVWQIRRRKK